MRWIGGAGLVVAVGAVVALVVGIGRPTASRAPVGAVGERAVTGTAPGAPAARSAAAELGLGHARIRGLVLRRERPASAEVELFALPSPPPLLGQLRGRADVGARLLRERIEGAEPLAGVLADARGRFVFSGIAPGEYRLRARAGDKAVADVVVEADGQEVEAHLRLRDGGQRLEGVVLAADGSPLEGLVLIWRQRRGDGWHAWSGRLLGGLRATARTDARGRFLVEGLRRGRVFVEAVVPERLRAVDHPVSIPHDGPYTFRIADHRGKVAAGRVVSVTDGRPIEGASVTSTGRHVVERTLTDAEGRFSVAQGLWLEVAAAGHATRSLSPGWKGTHGDVELHPEGKVSGRVVHWGTDDPVGGIDVFLVWFGPPRGASDRARVVSADAQGRFLFDRLPGGEYGLFAQGDGWFTRGRAAAWLERQSKQDPLGLFLDAGEDRSATVEVERGAERGGVALDAEGEPVPGAVIEAQSADYHRPDVQRAVTGASGRFRVLLVPRLRYRFTARSEGRSAAVVGNSGPIVLRFDAARTLRVVVRDEAGGPLGGVSVAPQGGYGRTVGRAVETDAHGEAVVSPLLDGVRRVRFEELGFETVVRDLDELLHWEVTLGPAALPPLRIQVLGSDGAPVGGAYVTVSGKGALGVQKSAKSVRSATDGWAVSLRPASGPLWVRAEGRGERGGARALESDPTVVVRLQPKKVEEDPDAEDEEESKPEHVLRFRIVDPAGRPVPRGILRLTFQDTKKFFKLHMHGPDYDEPWYMRFEDGTDETWGYPVIGPARRVEVEVYRAAAADGGPLRLGAVSLGSIAAAGTYTVRLAAEKAVNGRVLDAAGTPVRGALVWAFAAGRVPDSRPYHYDRFSHVESTYITSLDLDRTRADGTFRLGRLGSGPVAVVVDPPRGAGTAEPVIADPDGEPVTIRLAATASAVVRVVDVDGRAVAGARVRVDIKKNIDTWANRGGWSAHTDGAGAARLEGLAKGAAYRLRVTAPKDRADVANAELQGWTSSVSTIRLGRALSVRGFVRDARGRPVVGADVEARLPDRSTARKPTLTDGSFRFDRVPPGRVRLKAERHVWRLHTTLHSDVVEVDAGAADVVLRLARLPTVRVRIENWPPGEWESVQLVPQGDGADSDDTVEGYVRKGGVLEAEGVLPNRRYRTIVGPVGDGWVAVLQDLRASDEGRTAQLIRGGTIRGRVRLPEGAESPTVTLEDPAWTNSRSVGDDGSFRIEGVPPGTWRVLATATLGDRSWRGTAGQSSPGDHVEIELRPAD